MKQENKYRIEYQHRTQNPFESIVEEKDGEDAKRRHGRGLQDEQKVWYGSICPEAPVQPHQNKADPPRSHDQGQDIQRFSGARVGRPRLWNERVESKSIGQVDGGGRNHQIQGDQK
jgi:hypothetical protein